MNILVFSWRGPGHPLAGGAEASMHEHMKAWVKAGHKVTLFTSNYRNAQRTQTIDGVRIERKGIQYWGVQLAGAFHYLFSGERYDLIVDQFHGIPFFTPLYSRKPILAVVQEVAGRVWLANELPFPLNKIIGWMGYLGEPLLYLPYRTYQFMTGSNSAKDDLIKIGIKVKKINIIEHGVTVTDPGRVKKNKILTVAYLGALAKDKGIEDAVEAFGILNKKGTYNFYIIGGSDPKYLDRLRNKVNELNINKNTTFFGFVSEREKFKLLKKSHVLINPSLLEGWGLVNVEANAMGVPVVGYKSRGLVDSIKHNYSGILVNQNTPNDLATDVHKLLNNDAKYRQMSKTSIEWSRKFSWAKSTQKSLKLIESLIKT